MAGGKQTLQRALTLHQQGNLAEAAKIYRQLIRKNPGDRYALHYLGAIEAATGDIASAKSLMARSISNDPGEIMLTENYATMLCQAGDFEACLQICRQGLRVNGASAILMFNSGMAMFRTGRLLEAVQQFDRLLTFYPTHLGALNERGAVLAALKNHEASLESFDRALAVAPDFIDAHINRGTVYLELERYEEAGAAYDKALALNPGAAVAWLGRGNVENEFKRYDEALAAYDKAIANDPRLAEAWLARANLYFARTSFRDAAAGYDRAIALNPGLAGAWLGRGNLLFTLRQYEDALLAYDKARELKPDLADAWFGRGNVLDGLKRYGEALPAYDQALALKPGQPGWESARHHTKMLLCDWRNHDDDCARLLTAFRNGEIAVYPFFFLNLPCSSADQLRCAALWMAAETPDFQIKPYAHERIRVGYVSSDFNPHPVAHLIAGMIERHDRSRFEITGISLGPSGVSDIRQRLQESFDHFVDAGLKSDREIAELIRAREIDIVIDLNGITGGSRHGVFAQRCAPIQVNYLGYPGTMGAKYIDYILADRIVIPEDQRTNYVEKVVYLPDSYMVNDDGLAVSDHTPVRLDLGLPPEGFVFCCFNNNYKITPRVFDSWMRILGNVERSVLWLANANPDAMRNLRREAAARGIGPDRLVFAERLPELADHLARLRLADLFLDTLPYNAHATACNALWSGVPVLTCLGETFAGRVGASLLKAMHLPELITPTLDAYETRAIELARDPAQLSQIRDKLSRHRRTAPLFDTGHFTGRIEAAFIAMHERHVAGLPPDHIEVPQAQD